MLMVISYASVGALVLGTVAAMSGRPATAARPAGAIVRDIQRADYEGDRAALQRLYDELQPVDGEGRIASRVHYWRGFALWRRAFNGFNDSAPPEQMERDLQLAVAEFEKSAVRDPAFEDANVAIISCLQSLAFLRRADPAAAQALVPRFVDLLKKTMVAAPDNPRLLWVQGASEFYAVPGLTPTQLSDRRAAAMATYQRGLRLIRAQRPGDDPLEPTWGEPELLMNLAWSSLNGTTPDPVAAARYAADALRLVPYWHYVRDILTPQIRAASK